MVTCHSQYDSTEAPYKHFKGFPPVTLLLPDSSSQTIKNNLPEKRVVMLMIFNPGCEHCQRETEEPIQHIGEFRKVRIIMASMMSLPDIKSFIEKYQLNQYENIIVGQDTQFFLPIFFRISNLPFLAFYHKKKELISVFEGSLPIEKALLELNK